MVMNVNVILFMCFFFSGIWLFCSKRKHLLLVLLSLEYMVLWIFGMLVCYFSSIDYGLYFTMIYLVFSVCEGALGLGILVKMVRCYGNDYFQSFIILRC
uniref:NADH-ubiquinone oxidoreductase chain 4L n=1 Tax=Cacoplistes rogenhoferi TaxID=2316737 RepID=A0A385I1V9_9ORTH|nr:NADH dehydrogenase subunit 4L [Cacoplistes rogenhoferi]AXY63907.1 NADH dehydrogenase subunit 4L [Cacoplistes rogenhoferi]